MSIFSKIREIIERGKNGFSVGDGWTAKWWYRDNFFLLKDGRKYDVFTEKVFGKNQRVLVVRDMPSCWLSPHQDIPLTTVEREIIIEKAKLVIARLGEKLEVDRS